MISLQWETTERGDGRGHARGRKGGRETSEEAEVPVGESTADVEKLPGPERSGR